MQRDNLWSYDKMTAEKLYNLLNKWKNTSYLSEYTLIYDEVVNSQALKAFEYDYKRWYPNDKRSETT